MRIAPQPVKENRRHAADAFGVLLVTALAAYLRFAGLGKASLWMDEGASAAMARATRTDFIFLLLSREMNMAPYYLLLRLVPPLAHSEFALRLVPALFGILLVPLMWIVARRVLPAHHSRGASFLVIAAITLNGFLLTYSQEARAYSIALFFSTAALYFCVRAVQEGEGAVAWSICALLAFYDHFFTCLWLIPQLIFLLRIYRRRQTSIRTMIAVLVVGMLPIVMFFAHTRGGQLDWVPHLSFTVLSEIARQIGGYSIVSTGILFVAAAMGAVLFFRDGTATARAILTQAVVPPLILLVASVAHPVFVPRFLLFWVPTLFLCAARAAQEVSPVLAVAAAAPFFAAMISAKWHRPPQADWRSATTYLCSSDNRADAVFFSPAMAKFPFEYYLQQHAGCAPAVLPGSLELTERDFLYGKRDLAKQACSSAAQHPLLVLDSVSGTSPEELTGNCYRETSRAERNRLAFVEMERTVR